MESDYEPTFSLNDYTSVCTGYSDDENEASDEEFDDMRDCIDDIDKKQKLKRLYKCDLCDATYTRKKNRNTHRLGNDR